MAQAVHRADKITADVQNEILSDPALRESVGDKGVELDALANASPEEQREAISGVKSGEANSVREALGQKQCHHLNELRRLERAWNAAGETARKLFIENNVKGWNS